MSRVVWSILAPFCAVLALLAVITIARESGGGDDAAAAETAVAGTVTMEGTAFAPGELTAARGTEVVFDNNDVAPHTVTADDGSTDSGVIDPGSAFRLVAEGGFAYHCEIHPSMKAEIRIEG